jgi:hypothetical protein
MPPKKLTKELKVSPTVVLCFANWSSQAQGTQVDWLAVEKRGKEEHQIDMLTRQTFLGYAWMDIITGPVKLCFGKYNYCPLNEKEGDKLYDLMIEHGV